jgi:hypothetical protein
MVIQLDLHNLLAGRGGPGRVGGAWAYVKDCMPQVVGRYFGGWFVGGLCLVGRLWWFERPSWPDVSSGCFGPGYRGAGAETLTP